MEKNTEAWTEYEKQVAEWFATGACNCAEKTKRACREQQALWKSQHVHEVMGNKWDPWNAAGIPWEYWNKLDMQNLDPLHREMAIDTMNQMYASDPEWNFFKNNLNFL